MTSYETVLFDLDGTLCDPGGSITESVQYALSRIGIDETDAASLRRFVGPPLEHSLHDYYNLDDATISKAVDFYRERFGTDGINLYKTYDGIADLLKTLSDSGKTLGVVTAKPEKFARIILTNTDLIKYFDIIGARGLDEIVKKEVTMARVLGSLSAKQAASVVMVGDRMHDIEAAVPFGIDSIGVLYGYGTKEELLEIGATHIVETVDELKQVLTT